MWECPNHAQLREKCEVMQIEEYITQRRENLRKFLTEEQTVLWDKALKTRPLARDVRKILW